MSAGLFSFNTLAPGETDVNKIFAFFARISGVGADKDNKAKKELQWHQRLMESLRQASHFMVHIEGPEDLASAYAENAANDYE